MSKGHPKLREAHRRGELDAYLGSQYSDGPPVSVAHGSKTGTHFRLEGRKEYIGDIVISSTDFEAHQLVINPGNSSLFRWLAQIAGEFELYRFVKKGNHPGLVFEFRPINGTQNDGGCCSVIQMNSTGPIFPDKSSFMNYDGAESSPLWHGFVIVLDTDEADRIKEYRFVLPEGESLPSNVSALEYDVGSLNWATYGASQPIPFELYVHYNIDFKTAKVNPLSSLRTVSVEEVEGAGSFTTAGTFTGAAPVSQFQGSFFTEVVGEDAAASNKTTLSCPAELTNDCKNGFFMVTFAQSGSSTVPVEAKYSPVAGHMDRLLKSGSTEEIELGSGPDPVKGYGQASYLGTTGVSDGAHDNIPGGYQNYTFTGLNFWRTAATLLISGAKFLQSPEGKQLRLQFHSGLGGTTTGWARTAATILVTRVSAALYNTLVNPMTEQEFQRVLSISPDVSRHNQNIAMFHHRQTMRIVAAKAVNERKMGVSMPDLRHGTPWVSSQREVHFRAREASQDRPVQQRQRDLDDDGDEKMPETEPLDSKGDIAMDERDDGVELRVVPNHDGSVRLVPRQDDLKPVQMNRVSASPAPTPTLKSSSVAQPNSRWFS
jgi:hypothetical protein